MGVFAALQTTRAFRRRYLQFLGSRGPRPSPKNSPEVLPGRAQVLGQEARGVDAVD